ncbi:DUF4331 domain-containing protein [Ramlibacter tataouinensis]|uniref:DUF4331 domain-containing protein n=1 Tax=Ramlibacter tataouinensis (strain ATCC BAA-407 / DSM 14655 / LMG 21543 / TTB310) TaxID=365046 RepID=F5Y3N3_RAMTT|nr:DUF4331 domain-containing protein [Ramlibacter tataouinensis]AEG93690.1 Conserved hypothetical protein [Ramlibacter tataouinensis TTB310]
MKQHLGRLGAAVLLVGTAMGAFASSHREAPFTSFQRHIDGTDLYMFRSYEPGREGFVTVIANYIPFQDPQGGPNFYMFDPNALYEIHIDNNGDAKEDLSFQFRFTNTPKDTALNVGGKAVKIPLINSNTISGVNPASLNVRETYTVDLVRGDRRSGTRAGKLTNAAGGADTFDKPVDNIGEKTFSNNYAGYANQHIYNVNVPGCGTPARVFVGQRKEPFFIAVGKTFDLINLNPLGPEVGGNNNDLEAKNVSTIAMELPIACLTAGNEPVIGAYTTASVRQGRLIDGSPATGLNKASREGGPWAQVSRLGMPLVNEVVIGMTDKDKFNASRPTGDAQFLDYVTNPTLPALIQTLYPSAPAPTKFPRTDLVAAFLTGIQGLNKPANVVPSEMLRLNTSIAPTAAGAQNVMGVAGGDNAGFPNGRRPADDVVDIELRVAMGALCHLTGPTDTLQVGCAAADAPAGNAAITDGVRKTPADYATTFPYLRAPIPGNFNPPAPAGVTTP